ncbi:sulfite exporter TauE/SafE family protein [Candidatus Latescibacterota bacterium]
MPLLSILQLLLAGALAGLSAGFMGIGGGAVLTPICLLVYPAIGLTSDNLVKVIFGTNMFLVMAFSVSAVMKHHGNRKIDWRTVLVMGPLAIVGAVIGAWLADKTDPASLKKGFAALLLFSSILITLRGSTKPKGGVDRKAILPMKLVPLVGFIGGFIGSLLGIGGGAIMLPILILLFAFPMDRVAGTSSSVIVFIGLFGSIMYMWHGRGMVELPGWSTGYVWWSAALPLAIGGVPMARVGAWVNSKTNARILQHLFGLILLIIAVKLLFF